MAEISLLDQLTAGAALTMPQLAQSILTGTVTPTVTENGLQTKVPFDPGETPDPTGQYVLSEALASPDVLALFGLDASKGQQYVLVKVFAVPQNITDPDASAPLPPGQWPLPQAYSYVPYDNSGIKLQAWLLGSAEAPWQCAMATGTDSFILDGNGNQIPAPLLTTFPKSMCIGTGWVGKPSKEWAGLSSIPSQLITQG